MPRSVSLLEGEPGVPEEAVIVPVGFIAVLYRIFELDVAQERRGGIIRNIEIIKIDPMSGLKMVVSAYASHLVAEVFFTNLCVFVLTVLVLIDHNVWRGATPGLGTGERTTVTSSRVGVKMVRTVRDSHTPWCKPFEGTLAIAGCDPLSRESG